MREIIELAEQVADLTDQRLTLDRESKKLKKLEDDAKAKLMQELHKHGLSGFDTDGLEISMSELQKPYPTDWSALEAYIREHNAIDLLQKRLTESAVKLRWDDGIVVPGVGLQTVEKVNVRRIS